MKVIILYGSENDKNFLQIGKDYLNQEQIPFEEKVLSVHRNFDELIVYLKDVQSQNEKVVFIAAAGLSAALPGVVAVKVDAPVIGVPVPGGPLNGIDALLSIAQVPGDVPVVTVGLHKKAPLNACMYAHKILKMGE
ncbi:MAG: AIR carboxylase family protein [Kiritimatiellae bacterium]|nr:AIR carboxylase family protein [Kiritimatiellia bacterium]